MTTDPILILNKGFIIRISKDSIYAKDVGSLEIKVKDTSHIEDLWELPFKGIMKIAEEFLAELSQKAP